MNSCVRGMLLVAVLMALNGSVCLAQQQEPSKTAQEIGAKEGSKPADDFRVLRDKRASLLTDIEESERGLSTLRRTLEEEKGLQEKVNNYKRDLAEKKLLLDEARKAIPVNRGELKNREDTVGRYQLDLEGVQSQLDAFEKAADVRGVSQKIDKGRRDLVDKKNQLLKVESDIDNYLNIELAKQSFSFKISLTFACLVFVVIAGFFVVALRDEKVRCAVFSGHEGIQLITLFSLVIAIILFGIMGILEGKELAALLGGLSGYILGRGATQPSPPSPLPPSGPQPTPPPPQPTVSADQAAAPPTQPTTPSPQAVAPSSTPDTSDSQSADQKGGSIG